jgi:hypothetical protein
MKKLMFALACAASAAVMGADTLNNKATFEAFTAATTDTAGTTATALAAKDDANTDNGSKFWAFKDESSENDASVVTAYETAPAADNSKYLKLETNGDELQRKVNNGGTAKEVGDGLYIDTLVQFTATPDAPTVDSDAKLAIWLEGEDAYTLKVKGSLIDITGEGVLTATEKTYALDKACSPDTWYRLTVKSVASISGADAGNAAGFVVYIDGAAVATTEASVTAGAVNGLEEGEAWASDSAKALVTDNLFIPSGALVSGFTDSATLTSVGFQGSGAIDNVTITDEDLYPDVVPSVEFTLTINFGDGVSAVTYTVGETATDVTTSGTIVTLPQDTAVSIAAKTVADWFVAPAATEVTMTENKTVTVAATAASATDIGVTVPEGTSAETVSAALAWAKAANKTTAEVKAATTLFDNYLLNVTDLTVAPQIKIVSIDLSGETPAVTAEVTDANGTAFTKTLDATDIKGALKYKAAATLEALKTAPSKDAIEAGDQFIKIVVE